MQSIAAAVTMVRDDAFFLQRWLDHYGRQLGRENCYIVNHGRGPEVARMAEGCNLIGLPGGMPRNFDARRWRLLNNLVQGLRNWYNHVIVGDVDELVVVDPGTGVGLVEYLAARPVRRVLTPLGLEVIHRIDIEPEPVTGPVLGPRRHVRPSAHYSKPCIISAPVKISRGGHFTTHDVLDAPDDLWLFHLKFCDFANYVEVMNARNRASEQIGLPPREAGVGRHWFARARGEDRALFEGFARLPVASPFDLSAVRRRMRESWRPRGDTGFWQFDLVDDEVQYRLPDRFAGVI